MPVQQKEILQRVVYMRVNCRTQREKVFALQCLNQGIMLYGCVFDTALLGTVALS